MALLFPRLASPDARLALRVDGASLDYAALASAAAGHIARLDALGIVAGERVGVFTHGRVETLVALVGNALAGVVSVPLNPKLGRSELLHILSDAAPRLAFTSSPVTLDESAPELRVLSIEMTSSPRPAPRRLVDDAPLFILYTSGTTGAPKGALITARNVAENIDALAEAWAWSEADTVVHALPLFHVHGLVLGLFGSLRVGGCLWHQPRFDPERIAEALASGGSMLFAVPTMYHRIIEAAEARPSIAAGLRAARLLISGSAALPVREHRRIEALTGRGVHERYGLTETLIACALPSSGPPRPGYVGPPLPGTELRLVDDAREELDAYDDATIGEVALRSKSVFAGYLNRAEATAAVLDEGGWFYTGDLATRSADGALRIVGRRATDLIKTGGFKVGAGEVEACLLEDPDVREAAVLGTPDDDLGERILAFIVPRDPNAPPSRAALEERVARELTPHKRPREVHFVEALPRNPMGKVQKARLQDLVDD